MAQILNREHAAGLLADLAQRSFLLSQFEELTQKMFHSNAMVGQILNDLGTSAERNPAQVRPLYEAAQAYLAQQTSWIKQMSSLNVQLDYGFNDTMQSVKTLSTIATDLLQNLKMALEAYEAL
jgi:hypothetical protein